MTDESNCKTKQTHCSLSNSISLFIFGLFIGIFTTMLFFSKSRLEEPVAIAEIVKSYIVIADQKTILPDALRAGTIHYTSALTNATLLLHECKNEITQMNSMQIADSTSFKRAERDFYGTSLPLEEILTTKLNLVLQIHNYVIARNIHKYSEGIFEQRIKEQQLYLEDINGNFQKMEIAFDNIQMLHANLCTQLQDNNQINES